MRSEMTFPLSRHSAATRIAMAFVVWSALWVIASDSIVHVLSHHLRFWHVQTVKGLIYVAVSGFLLWLSVRAMEKDEASRRKLNEARLRRLGESGLLGIAGRTPSGKVCYANETLVQMLQYSYHELIGMEMAELVAPHHRYLREKAELQIQQLGRTALFELELQRKDGSMFPIIGGRALVSGPTREEIAYYVDMTELKQAQQEREELAARLHQSEKMNALGQLAGGIAHDFNNELAVIIGYASLLDSRLIQDETLRKDARQVLKAADRARVLIRQLLAFSRRQTLHKQVIELNHAIAEMYSMLRPVLRDNIELRLLPSTEEEYIEIDSSQFQQVVMNLVVNARDAMPDGGLITISLTHSKLGIDGQPGECVVLTVSDTGAGMDESVRRRIFEPFFTTKERSGGTGLGLAMVYGIVKQSMGDIEVNSAVGRGTSFVIRLPRAHKAMAAPVTPPVKAPESLSGTVLLVEDLADLREMMMHILSHRGMRVLPAADGVEAVRVASQTDEPIDIIVTDVMMPNMNGPDAVAAIRGIRPGVKALYLSGYTESIIPQGGDVLLSKPATPEALIKAIHECLTHPSDDRRSNLAA